MTTTTETYNGYTNYETWAVSLWLDNEPYLQERLLEIANSHDHDGLWAKEQSLKELVEDMREEWQPYGASMFDDLLNAALGEVNYLEIIKNAIEEDEDDS